MTQANDALGPRWAPSVTWIHWLLEYRQIWPVRQRALKTPFHFSGKMTSPLSSWLCTNPWFLMKWSSFHLPHFIIVGAKRSLSCCLSHSWCAVPIRQLHENIGPYLCMPHKANAGQVTVLSRFSKGTADLPQEHFIFCLRKFYAAVPAKNKALVRKKELSERVGVNPMEGGFVLLTWHLAQLFHKAAR